MRIISEATLHPQYEQGLCHPQQAREYTPVYDAIALKLTSYV